MPMSCRAPPLAQQRLHVPLLNTLLPLDAAAGGVGPGCFSFLSGACSVLVWVPASRAEGLVLSDTREESSSRLERESFSLAGTRQGVLLVLMTADTRRGTETAKGSEMFRAFRW